MYKKIKTALKSPAYQVIIAAARKNWSLLGINLFTNLLSALLEGSTLGIIYIAVSLLSQSSPEQKIPALEKLLTYIPLDPNYLFVGLLFLAALLQTLLALSNYVNKLSAAYFSARLQPQVTGQVFKQIMSLSFSCASSYKIGDLTNFVGSSSGAVNNQITTINNLIIGLSFTVIYSLVLVRLSPFLAIAAIFLAVAIVLIQKNLLPKLRQAALKLNNIQVNLSKQITENIQALRLIHTSGKQEYTTSIILESLNNVEGSLKKRSQLLFLPEPILEILPMVSLGILASLAFLFNQGSEGILPMLLTFLVALQRLSIRLRGVSGCFSSFADNSAQIHRLDSILALEDKEFSLVGGQTFNGLTEDIVFQNVSLSYTKDNEFALKDLNFSIQKHKVTALVGQSGAGKSSIVDLLIGLYRPTQGKILINGEDLSVYDPSSWCDHLGVVSQDTFIFNMSIAENLRYGSWNASLEEVIEAAKSSQAHEFILDLPNGYDTIVGERGYRLSGGQRQRLALARAILKQPEILILDEATSALDSHSELLIQQALEKFQKDRTVLVVAHRLSTIINADQILVFKQGQLIEKGNHEQLIAGEGMYAHYWHLQTVGKFRDWSQSKTH